MKRITMKHIKVYESWEDEFFSGGKKPGKEYKKPLEILSDAIMDAAVLFRNSPGIKNEDIALMLSETSRLLQNDPLKLTEILEKINSKRSGLEMISRILNNKGSGWSPEGVSKEGFIEIMKMSNVMISNPNGVSAALGLPVNAIYSMGVHLYFIGLAILDDDMFNYFKLCFGLA
jgi:hypothetical protein